VVIYKKEVENGKSRVCHVYPWDRHFTVGRGRPVSNSDGRAGRRYDAAFNNLGDPKITFARRRIHILGGLLF